MKLSTPLSKHTLEIVENNDATRTVFLNGNKVDRCTRVVVKYTSGPIEAKITHFDVALRAEVTIEVLLAKFTSTSYQE